MSRSTPVINQKRKNTSLTMEILLLVAIGTIYTASFTPTLAKDRKAKVLLELDEDRKLYKPNEDVLKEITELQQPIRVIAAIGNARVGKSTMLNLISRTWDKENETLDSSEKVFETGDSAKAVTRNVWAHIIRQPKTGIGSILLIDVEGTNLGDDRITDQLSMFTAMISSSLIIFAKDFVGNSDINFLYRISRLSDLVFPNKSGLQNYPKLHVVIRSDLEFPEDNGDGIRDAIFKPNNEDGAQNKGEIIKKYFPRESIVVSHIPYVYDPKILLNDFVKLRNSSYWNAFENLLTTLRKTPEKKTFDGNLVDGVALEELAEKLVKAMNENEWKDFGDVYSTIEKDICRRSYKKHVEPVLKRSSSKIADMMIETMDKFKEDCFLDSERQNAKNELTRALEAAKEHEEREERKERKKKEEEQRRKQEEQQSWFTYENFKTYYAPLLATNILNYLLFSDEHLKNNVTTLPHSQYSYIGLTGVCWTWNEVAERKFGLTGESCGVIAQEVQTLYSWAVTEGKDGYLRVGYHILHQMINDALD